MTTRFYSAPQIRRGSPGKASITGGFTLMRQRTLPSCFARAPSGAGEGGAEHHHRANLGQDSINRACWPRFWRPSSLSILGRLYRYSGIIANIALGLNLIYLLGVFSAFKATMTLPGIAVSRHHRPWASIPTFSSSRGYAKSCGWGKRSGRRWTVATRRRGWRYSTPTSPRSSRRPSSSYSEQGDKGFRDNPDLRHDHKSLYRGVRIEDHLRLDTREIQTQNTEYMRRRP